MNFLYESADIYDKIKVLFKSLYEIKVIIEKKGFFFYVIKRLDTFPYKKTIF